MKTSYAEWLANAPESYREDGFFMSRQPVAITSRYGQKKRIGGSDADEVEEDTNWDIDQPWNEISHVTVALATHVR